jgi:hypothetical protein
METTYKTRTHAAKKEREECQGLKEGKKEEPLAAEASCNHREKEQQ